MKITLYYLYIKLQNSFSSFGLKMETVRFSEILHLFSRLLGVLFQNNVIVIFIAVKVSYLAFLTSFIYF
jgi:hypothetical protein